MKSTFLQQIFTDTSLTAAGLLIFFGFFLTVCAWVYLRKGAKKHYEQMSLFPLKTDGENYE